MIQLTSPNGIRAARLKYGQQLAWDLEGIGREVNRIATAADAAGGGSATVAVVPIWAIRTVTVSTLFTATDVTILADATAGAVTITLLPAPPKGRVANASKIDATSNGMILDGNGWNINGAPTVTITTQDVNLQLQFSGTEWRVI